MAAVMRQLSSGHVMMQQQVAQPASSARVRSVSASGSTTPVQANSFVPVPVGTGSFSPPYIADAQRSAASMWQAAGFPGLTASPRARSSAAPPPMVSHSSTGGAERLMHFPTSAAAVPGLGFSGAIAPPAIAADGRPPSERQTMPARRASSTPSLLSQVPGAPGGAPGSIVNTALLSKAAHAQHPMAPPPPVASAQLAAPSLLRRNSVGGGSSASAAGYHASPRRSEASSNPTPRDAPDFARALSPNARALSPSGSREYGANSTDDISAIRDSSALSLSEVSPRRRKKTLRADRLYEDALARRQRQRELKDEADRHQRDTLEECKRDALLRQRERQRTYRFRDTRTHEEREEALLKRREERTRALRLEQQRLEQSEYQACTFQPKLYTRREDGVERMRSTGHQIERSSSCSFVGTQDGSRARQESPRDAKLQKFLEKQQVLIRKLAEVDADTEIARHSRKDRMAYASVGGKAPHADFDARELEVRLYKRHLDVVHSLERLDTQILELPQAELERLLSIGYRIGLAEGARRGLQSPREASLKALAETPRNNLREARTAALIAYQEHPNGATEQCNESSPHPPPSDRECDFIHEESHFINGDMY